MDLLENFDDVDFHDEDDDLMFSESSLELEMGGEPLRTPLESLSNVDYSLNSPLIRDELEEFIKFYSGHEFRKSWNIKLWISRRDIFKGQRIVAADLGKTELFHKIFFEFLLTARFSTVRFQQLIKLTQANNEKTWEIPSAFLKAWLKVDVPCPDKSKLTKQTLKYGSCWMELHLITLLLNTSSKKEKENLCKNLKLQPLTYKGSEGIKYESHIFGVVIVTNGFVLFKNLKILADRNILLMMKDVVNSRMQALMSMQNRLDKKFSKEDVDLIEKIYIQGDKIIVDAGNNGYDCIKMVEPICNLRMIELAQQTRPKIPLFTEFRQHIQDSIINAEQSNHLLQDLFDTITHIDRPDLVLAVYGSFRHWGHPFLEYMDGLRKLHSQTTLKKKIDKGYARNLASDLALIVIRDQFHKTKKWVVDISKLRQDHMLYENIKNNTWPTPYQLKDFGDRWHTLPLTKCFEVPDVIDPSLIYSDKSHSLTRKEIKNHLKSKPDMPIPSHKVLNTFINTPATDWKKFLQEVNDIGLPIDDLVIGLRGKEREIKRLGRFFSLMSWKLRDYFVITEYLIKVHYLPLFSGLTMADDLNTVIKKMLDTSNGQGLSNYDYITIANHIDYEKWNNHQRGEANNPVFKVMGQFLGYPMLFTRTHEFFENSLIYYNARADLMCVKDGEIQNKDPDQMVCWEGQVGGMEGLRQKGWSIVNLLVIRREGVRENTKVRVLAQGDNQVICTQYKLQKTRTEDELLECIRHIVRNNNSILKNIELGTKKLGLIINQDETIKSADYLNYGKVPIYRGNIKGLENKRWSRVTCVSNDQLPTLSNILSTVSSNALSVGYFSETPVEAISHYNFIGNFVLNILDLHNPAVRDDIKKTLNKAQLLNYKSRLTNILLLYLDPSLGGISGMSLTRFLIRGFPDPVTESLSFWKGIQPYVGDELKRLISSIGSPELANYNKSHFPKLLENPLALNIRHSVNPIQKIKEEIMRNLIANCDKIPNKIVKHAVQHTRDEEHRLYLFLASIEPVFPRFLSEYKSSTYLGLTESLVSLFQNSKTVRNVFSKNMKKEIDLIIIKSETQGLTSMLRIVESSKRKTEFVWMCSSTLADTLRTRSWGTKIIGATVPHPFEMTSCATNPLDCCAIATDDPIKQAHLEVLVPKGVPNQHGNKGPYKPYLGSKTAESTSLLRPWEKEAKIPLIRRAADLRKSFNWFVDPESSLGRSILSNLVALTGEEWDQGYVGVHRSGSALHRFGCSRQSQGGYISNSPLYGTWIVETTDPMGSLGDVNYDFLFQALLLFGQITVGTIHQNNDLSRNYHFHITCEECLRPVNSILLTSSLEYEHKSVSHILNSWKPENSSWLERRPKIQLLNADWDIKTQDEKSFHVGKTQGFLFSHLISVHLGSPITDNTLFPLVLKKKLSSYTYMLGLLNGLVMGASIIALYKRSIQQLKKPTELLIGQVIHLMDAVSQNEGLINIWREDHFLNEFITIPHKIPSSYPLTNRDLGLLGRNFLKSLFSQIKILNQQLPRTYHDLWVFGDIVDPDIILPFVLSKEASEKMYLQKLTKIDIERLRTLRNSLHSFKDNPDNDTFDEYIGKTKVYKLDQELRHAMKFIDDIEEDVGIEHTYKREIWGKELVGIVLSTTVPYTMSKEFPHDIPIISKIKDPLISGLRLFQCPTGAHYKMRSLLEHHQINFQDAIVGGDGSGGISSMILRYNPNCRVLFNSLLELEGVELKGSSPSPPSAIACIPSLKRRCINYNNAWKNPTDLSKRETWDYFVRTKRGHHLIIDLIILDMEIKDSDMTSRIESLVYEYCTKLLTKRGILIFKTYLERLLLNWETGILATIGPLFYEVSVNTTHFSSSHTSEVYIIFKYPTSTNLKGHPSYANLEKTIKWYPVLQTEQQEFNRALTLPIQSMFLGVPPNRISDPCRDMSVMLMTLGVETGVSGLIGEMLSVSTELEKESLPKFIFVLSLNSILKITREEWTLTEKCFSDTTVYKVGVLVIGYLTWVAWKHKNFDLKRRVQNYITNMFLFSWKWIKNHRHRYQKFISFTGKFKSHKNFYLDSKIGQISALIRVFERSFPFISLEREDNIKINQLLGEFDESLTLETFSHFVDWEDIKQSNLSQKKFTPTISVDMVEGQEITWTEY